jgi:MFS family permease
VISRRDIAGIFGGLFCGYVGLTAVIPVLPGFVRARFGAADLAVGLVVTATGLSALLTRPVVGGLADRYGHRLLMQLGAVVVMAAGLLYFLPLPLPALVAVRLMLGVGEASLFTPGAVWAVSMAGRARRGQLIGLYGVSMWGGISAGTFLGGVLQRFGYHAVWGLSAAAPLAGLALISLAPGGRVTGGRAPRGHDPGGQAPGGQAPGGQAPGSPVAGSPAPGSPASRSPALRSRILRRGSLLPRPALLPGASLGLAAAGYAGLASFLVLFLRARGIPDGAAVLSAFSAAYAGTRLFIGHLPDRLGPRRMAAWSGLGEAAGLLIIALAPDLPVALAGSLAMGAGFSLFYPSLALMVMNRAPQAQQGAALGAYASFWDLGLAVWGPVTGVIAASFGYQAVFVIGAVSAVGATAVSLLVRRPAPEPALAQPAVREPAGQSGPG